MSSGDSYFPDDCFEYAIDIFHHPIIPEPDNTIAMSFDNPCPLGILASAMLAPIELNNESEASYCKVSDIGTDGKLSDEFGVVQLPIAEPGPKPAFGIGRFAAKLPLSLC